MYKWSYLDSLGFGLRGPFEQAGAPWLMPSLLALPTKVLFAPTGPLFAIINGTAGDDVLVAFTDFNDGDTVNSLAGNDTIDATSINVLTVFAGADDDVVTIDPTVSGTFTLTLDGGHG